MIKLQDKLVIKGIGREVTSSIVKRNGDICFYQRGDGPYEVFRVQVSPEEDIKGKSYPEREVYPGNEDFGKSAWCFTEFGRANERFKELVDY